MTIKTIKNVPVGNGRIKKEKILSFAFELL